MTSEEKERKKRLDEYWERRKKAKTENDKTTEELRKILKNKLSRNKGGYIR